MHRYSIELIKIIDMFPKTDKNNGYVPTNRKSLKIPLYVLAIISSHVETLCRLYK